MKREKLNRRHLIPEIASALGISKAKVKAVIKEYHDRQEYYLIEKNRSVWTIGGWVHVIDRTIKNHYNPQTGEIRDYKGKTIGFRARRWLVDKLNGKL